MRFNLILLMTLAAIASIGSPSPVSLLTNLPNQLKQCYEFADRFKTFQNCDVPRPIKPAFLEEAIPYMCLLTLNLIVEMCKENGSGLWESFQAQYKTHVNRTICPFNYATEKENLGLKVSYAANYFKNEKNCESVCHINKNTLDDCIVMASANDLMKLRLSLNEKGDGVAMKAAPRAPQLPLQQVLAEEASKQIVASPKHRLVNNHPVIVEAKAERPVVKHDEIINKSDSKTTVKTETTSECETKDKEEKINIVKGDTKPKSDISGSSKGIHANNNSNIVNSDAVNAPEKEAANNVNTNNKIVNNDSNNYNNNNDNNEELEAKVGPVTLNADNIDLTEPEVPPLQGKNDPSLYSPSSVKKSHLYSPTMKSPSDEGEDVDNNEEMQENAQLQDMQSDREYDSGRVPNPKELYNGDGLFQAEDSHFSAYFLVTVSIIIIGYIVYHNKNKIVAYALEGRRGRNGRRRPTSASYRKLDCNLEEAIASNPSHASVTNVVY